MHNFCFDPKVVNILCQKNEYFHFVVNIVVNIVINIRIQLKE
ncbi:MAG: hypothetical protein O6939_11840 [Bacteroidetes bacterium]|nr:hypothetical protein [Bacteroidota bacterium]